MKERALTALERGMPDTVPIFDSLDDSHIIKVMNSRKSTPGIKVECYKKLGFDAIPVKTRTYEKEAHRDTRHSHEYGLGAERWAGWSEQRLQFQISCEDLEH